MAPGLGEPEACLDNTRHCAVSPWDIPGAVSCPEQEPLEPSGVGPRAPVRIAPGLPDQEAGLDPTRPCAMSPWDIPGVVSCPEQEPLEPAGPGRVAPTRMPPSTAEPQAGPAPTSPCAASTPCAVREEPLTILQFPCRLVAEQLTLICAELFTKASHNECKAYTAYKPHMGRRYQREKANIEHVAPTIHKVMKQFEATVRLVTTSCLGTPSMTARDRARVVEFWIQVAKECETFLNFASFHAILLALQCPPVGRLKSTWGHVSWKSSYMFRKLKKKDKKADRQCFHEVAKHLLMRWQWNQRTPHYKENQGMVPFLGHILDDVPIDQLPEDNDEVISILYEIGIQRRVARQYNLEPDEHFQSFLQAMEPLDEQHR
ncbi:ral-GDS-related protein-like [Manis javanica]|uniref:ral-GDS-related protein-like n=1 Tax=Manis javanica TaxID=9974 RepID=UPI003C6D9F68